MKKKDYGLDAGFKGYVASPRKPVITNMELFKKVVFEGEHKMVNGKQSGQKTFSQCGKAVNQQLLSLDASSKNENAFFKEYYRPDTPENFQEKYHPYIEKKIE